MNAKKTFLLLFFIFISSYLFSQSNFTLEWQSTTDMGYWYSVSLMEKNNNIPDFVFVNSGYTTYKVYDGNTHQLKYTINWLSDSSIYYFPLPYNFNLYVPLDVNNDNINEIITIYDQGLSSGGNYIAKIINGANGNLMQQFSFPTSQTQYNALYYFDADGDGFTELILYVNGILRIYSTTSTTEAKLNGITQNPKDIVLKQNFPNPFNSETIIEYSVEKQSNVRIIVYDITGKEITTLINEQKNPGTYRINLNSSKLSSGTYFYTIFVDGISIGKKMMVLK